MTRRARNPTMYADLCEHYIPPKSEYRPDGNPMSYPMIPESYPKITGWGPKSRGKSKARYPEGLVDIYGEQGILGARVRRISPSYLDRVLKGKSTVAMRQNYIRKIVDNRRSPEANVNTAVRYVRDNYYMFVPEQQSPMYSDDFNRVIAARNGSGADEDFVGKLSRKFPRLWSR